MILITLTKTFFGLIIIFAYFWNRFLRNRSTVEIDIISFTYGKAFLLVIIISFFLVLIINNVRKLLNMSTSKDFLQNIKNIIFVSKILYFVREYIIKSPQYIYEKLTQNIDLQPFIEKPASYFTKYCYYPRTLGIGLL